MPRETAFALLAVSFLAATSGGTPQATPPADGPASDAPLSPRDAEMYAVYSAVLDLPTKADLVASWRNEPPPHPVRGLIVACGEIAASDAPAAAFREHLLEWLHFPAEHAPDVDEIVQDQEKQAGRRLRLKGSLPSRWRHEVVSELDAFEIGELMQGHRLTVFSPESRRRAREASYLVHPGYVYFNRARTLAVLSYHEFCGDLCSESYWRVLAKTAGEGWKHLRWGARSVVS
jgi:muconolactone delta-isomerase